MIFHCLNRGNEKRELFADRGDYAAFERVMEAALAAEPVRLLAYCLMPNHWHLLLWPTADGQLGRFMGRLTTTHVRRWQAHRHCEGTGHLYQGSFKSFPVQDDRHFLLVARYVERNALRAGLADRAERWQWGSLWRRESGSPQERGILAEWPLTRPKDWIRWVNQPQSAKELAALHQSLKRGQPFGDAGWQGRTAAALNLQSTFRPRGRPSRKVAERKEN
jgi:putative transposase